MTIILVFSGTSYIHWIYTATAPSMPLPISKNNFSTMKLKRRYVKDTQNTHEVLPFWFGK